VAGTQVRRPKRSRRAAARRISELRLASPGFENGAPIPSRYTVDGENVSPPLYWSGLPEGTASVAILCEDPLGPRGTPFALWVLFNLPPSISGIPEGLSKDSLPWEVHGGVQGINDLGRVGYDGPSPPVGHRPHLYEFQVFALDQMLTFSPTASRLDLRRAIEGHLLGMGKLVGTYRR
jgi:Raf kinase inhibitor-like YbhB/YbcL family protein